MVIKYRHKIKTFFLSVTFFLLYVFNGSCMAEKHILYVDLQHGFQKSRVIISINNKKIFAKNNLSTNLSTGLATHFVYEVEGGTCEFNIVIDNHVFNQKIVVDKDLYLGMGLLNQKSPYLTITDSAFLYD
jgi:hypothetical protein